VTAGPTISGTVTDASPIASFRAGFDSTPVTSFLDVTADLKVGGAFRLDPGRLSKTSGLQAQVYRIRPTDRRSI
jgi:hypothetical protein